MAQFAVTGEEAAPMTDRKPAWPIYDIFDTSDGQVFVGAVTDTQWHVFCDAFALDDLASDPGLATRQQRVAQRPRTLPRVAAVLRGYTRAGLMEKCEALGLPYAPIVRPVELFDDPHLNASGGLLPVTLADGRKTKLPALPLALDGTRLGVRRDLATVGQHDTEIAGELGYSEAEVAALRAAGVLV
jgi:crotonobetainyl-CoA:carnitine CoA-transferase CaiB-like acyl-CoA transferase